MKLILALILSLGAQTWAMNPKTFEEEKYVPQIHEYSTFSFNTAGLYSTFSLSGLLDWFSYRIDGGTATVELRYTSSTDAGSRVHISSPVTILENGTFSDDVRGFMWNPLLIVRGLSAGATAYVNAGTLVSEDDVR